MVGRGKELGRSQGNEGIRARGIDGPTMDTKKDSQRSERGPEERGSMDHWERREFPKSRVSSSETEQESDPMVPVRFDNKDAAGNLSEGPSVETEANWGTRAVNRKGAGQGTEKQ